MISRKELYFSGSFHHSDLLAFITHPLSKHLFKKAEAEECVRLVKRNNITFLNQRMLNEMFSFLVPFLGESCVSDPTSMLDSLNNILERCKTNEDEDLIGTAAIAKLQSTIYEVRSYASKYQGLIDLKTIAPLLNRMLQAVQIPFSGEPLEGLQVMGMLESRTLSFDNVIVIGMNEGIIPKGKTGNSFIPFDLKIAFQINSYRENDSIFAYHFYRLISRAKKAFLLYDPNPEDYGNAEVSRFVTQLKFEPIPNVTFKESVYQNQVQVHTLTEVPINAADCVDRIEEMLAEKISQSGLNTFISCPRDFYYKYVLQLREEDEVEESLEDRTFGNILHKTLEDIYDPFLGKEIDPEKLLKQLEHLSRFVQHRYQEETKLAQNVYGENLISQHVIEDYIRRFVEWEAKEIKTDPRKLIALELKTEMPIQYRPSKTANLFGIIDRLEERKSGLHVIDYKSGKVGNDQTGNKDISMLFEKPSLSKAMQLVIYGLFAQYQYQRSDVHMGWYSFRELSKGLIPLKIQNSNYLADLDIDTFNGGLIELLQKMTDPKLALTHNPDAKYCEFCGG